MQFWPCRAGGDRTFQEKKEISATDIPAKRAPVLEAKLRYFPALNAELKVRFQVEVTRFFSYVKINGVHFEPSLVGNGRLEGKMILFRPALHVGFDNTRDKDNLGIHKFFLPGRGKRNDRPYGR